MAGVGVMVRDKYAVRLAQEQREELQRLVRVGKNSARVTASRLLKKVVQVRNIWFRSLKPWSYWRELCRSVNGGGMLDHCGGEKVYHQGSSASARVRANCSGRMSPGQPKRQTGWGIRTGSGATYASSGSWEPALSLLRLRR